MPPTLEKSKRKKKSGFKQKQKQQQTVIVNINKRTPVQRGERSGPRNNGIEKPKETPKEQPKTYNSFSFSMPQAQQNPIGEYLKVYNKELYAKIEQSLKSKDAVINSSDEAVKPIISVKSPERIPTPLEFITPPKSLENTLQKIYLRKQEEQTPLTIGEPTDLEDITTLDDPQNILLDEPPEEPSKEEVSNDTVEALKKVEESPDLSTEIKRGRGRPKGSTNKTTEERNLMGAEDKPVDITKETIKSLQTPEVNPDLLKEIRKGRGPDKKLRFRRSKDQIVLDENRKIGLLETRRNDYVRDKKISPPYSPSSLNLGSSILGTTI